LCCMKNLSLPFVDFVVRKLSTGQIVICLNPGGAAEKVVLKAFPELTLLLAVGIKSVGTCALIPAEEHARRLVANSHKAKPHIRVKVRKSK
jgi:hypothetical protein